MKHGLYILVAIFTCIFSHYNDTHIYEEAPERSKVESLEQELAEERAKVESLEQELAEERAKATKTNKKTWTESTRPPNVLLFIMDQVPKWAIGAYRNDDIGVSRNIDWLAETGVKFQRWHTPVPICIPARMAMMSGRFPKSGSIANPESFLKHPTLGHHFQEAGYHTGYIGKYHCPNTFSDVQRPKVGSPLWLDADVGFVDTAFMWYVMAGNHPISCVGAGVQEKCFYGALHQDNYTTYSPTKFVTQKTIELIRSQENASTPWLYVASYRGPHGEQMPESRFHSDLTAEMLLPDDEPTTVPDLKFTKCIQTAVYRKRSSSPTWIQQVQQIDKDIGLILKELRALGILNDTIVIYASDHGEMGGSHGLFHKVHPHQHSVNVPMIIRYPQKIPAGTTVDDVVFSHIDLLPTMLSLAGVPLLEPVHGIDATPYIDDKATNKQLTANTPRIMRGWVKTPFLATVSALYKIVYTHVEAPVLFDLSIDPHETTNRYEQKQYKQVILRHFKVLQHFINKTNDGYGDFILQPGFPQDFVEYYGVNGGIKPCMLHLGKPDKKIPSGQPYFGFVAAERIINDPRRSESSIGNESIKVIWR